MIAFLDGVAAAPHIVMTSGGVGYLIQTAEPLPVGDPVSLHVTTVVREDAIILFGFRDELEQQLFDALTKVQGVGPAGAMSLLRDLTPAGVVSAIVNKDARALAKARGLGAKTAEKLLTLVKLSPALLALATAPTQQTLLPQAGPTSPQVRELAAALEGLGYTPAHAKNAAEYAAELNPGGDDAQLLTAALGILRDAL